MTEEHTRKCTHKQHRPVDRSRTIEENGLHHGDLLQYSYSHPSLPESAPTAPAAQRSASLWAKRILAIVAAAVAAAASTAAAAVAGNSAAGQARGLRPQSNLNLHHAAVEQAADSPRMGSQVPPESSGTQSVMLSESCRCAASRVDRLSLGAFWADAIPATMMSSAPYLGSVPV